VIAAKKRGIRALAIHKENLEDAKIQPIRRDLWQEAKNLEWDLLAFSPEMLKTSQFKDLITYTKFLARLAFCFVDECHLVVPWSCNFRPLYKSVVELRCRVPTSVMWAAFSATLKHPDGRRDAQQALGFTKDKFHDVMLSTDRADIKYVNRFTRNPTTGDDFADFAYLISGELTRTMIAVETIEKATRFINWLDRNLPDDLPERDLVVQPFHSLISAEDRKTIL
jgi:superfamily II DNA helicase RecQ